MFRDGHTKKFWWPVLIFFCLSSNLSSASTSKAAKPQLEIGDKLSIFSDKAYRKNNGQYFEAVGNVVIISGNDTIYGELASLDQATQRAKIEGNVRVITQQMTLYGSHLDYNIVTGSAVIKNARILAMDFNLVANELIRINENEYVAKEAEFTTCRDCAESWSVFGKEIRMKVNKYVSIKNGLARIKGVDVLYIPYIVLPVQSKRKTGLLFPNFSTRLGEGLALAQPVFWAIDESKDATISPTFWATRGYGGDLQYRQRFTDMSWFHMDARLLNDKIYQPGATGQTPSGEEFFRYFTELETHQQVSSNFGAHIRYTAARDLDIVRDHPMYTDDKINSSDMGLSGFADWRKNYFSMGANAQYLRNQLYHDPMEFDRNYVQTVPRVYLSSIPYSIFQSDLPGLQHISLGFDGSMTRFRQVDENKLDELTGADPRLRNSDRLSVQPYILWHLITKGPFSLNTRYTYDQQVYKFQEKEQSQFGKNAGIFKTEFSFTMDKIFGLAYEEKIPIKYIPEKDLKELREKKEQGLAPLKRVEKKNRLVGELPTFESELARDNIVQVRNSYRHSQDFKFIHHYIASENEYGNSTWRNQIDKYQGWFDYEDAIRSQEFMFGANTTRTMVPPQNTLEFQWNNTLIRKRPKVFSYLVDDKYLRDNFTYSRIGWFNVSQGYLLNQDPSMTDDRQRLTRLSLATGYSTEKWILNLQEYYFHYEQKNIFNVNFNRRFEYLRLLGQYTYNNFGQSKLNTVSYGAQIRPLDTLGFAIMQDLDLEAHKNIRRIYNLDIMPHNNCWILNLNFRESLVDSRFSFNVLFNFGDDKFAQYRNDYFAVKSKK